MNVSFLPAARRDILLQVEYLLEECAYDAAVRFPVDVRDATELLARHPEAGTRVVADLRSWPLGRFPKVRLYYRTTGAELLVVRILHGARDLPSVLGEGE
ncbi:MAG: type II toxin-antitoxin system RelE/ParE family toxin [Gemmatimonadaceae bacterium]